MNNNKKLKISKKRLKFIISLFSLVLISTIISLIYDIFHTIILFYICIIVFIIDIIIGIYVIKNKNNLDK